MLKNVKVKIRLVIIVYNSHTLPIGILLLTLTAVLPAEAEVSDDQIFDYLYRRIKGQIGNHPVDGGLWEDARNGGYLLQFSMDIFGDQDEDDFLVGSMSLNGTAGNWKIFSDGVTMGWVKLSGIEFVAIRERDTTRLLHIGYGGLNYAYVLEQTISKNGIERVRKEVHPRELDGIREQWERNGEVIRPKIKVILLADFLRGSREWKAIDLQDENTVTYTVSNLSRLAYLVLKSDEARLSEMDFTPEMAFELLQSSMQASAEAKPDAAQEPSVINTQVK